MPYLIQKKTDGTIVHQWELHDKALVFGRGQEVENRIDDKEMSRRHFAIEPRNAGFVVRDLDTTNGTWVNSKRVMERELKPGDRILAGQTTFVFEKGLGTIIGELAKEQKGYSTQLGEISKGVKS